jgi:hypothetical protein
LDPISLLRLFENACLSTVRYVSEKKFNAELNKYAKLNGMHIEEYMYSTLNNNMPFRICES